ncbi:DUF1853 family protein [Gilvimarinus sp. DA14]|uniref:DUF1853 family protein n=1 Tax=Gilvimarinus sp. DA14 TaxID=2956798 RepID=UPI0020B6F6F6|nr:DUF1853 family protein [Gilvimarinus sp. DA14]UTF60716.1 DUF1853 family protein [Gilvimarinus sp. DA14]
MTPANNCALQSLLPQLRCRQVRELAYACFGPSLMSSLGDASGCYEAVLDKCAVEKLLALDRDPKPLLHFIAQVSSTRLGVYFETLWRFYWLTFSDERLLGHNIQVTRTGKTLGAFDFIVRANQQLSHIEAALKFYLGFGSDLTLAEQWLGPNASDNLGKKLHHMRTHQLRLGESNEGKASVQLLANSSISRTQFLLKGYLFAPAHGAPELPPGVSSEAVQGRWYYLDQLTYHVTPTLPTAYTIVPRNHWVAPVIHHRALQPLNNLQLLRALKSQLTRLGKPKMVAKLVQMENGVWYEWERFFVVPDQWPGTASPSLNT